MKYLLLQNKSSGEIILIDNRDDLDNGRFERLIKEGYVGAGFIESDLRRHELNKGFSNYYIEKNTKLKDKIYDAIKILEGA